MIELLMFVAAAGFLENSDQWGPVSRWPGIAIEFTPGKMSLVPLVFPDKYEVK